MVGIHNFKPDDYLIVLAWITYTVMTVAAHLVGGLGDLHAITMEQRRELTPEEAQSLILGTQWFCAGVATYVLFIWILKLNMLFLYQRIVSGLWVAKFIKPTMGLVVATLFAIMMILFCSCRPYNRMWMVYPDQGEICKPQATINLVPALIMNILTDMCIMAIPAPVILPVRTTIWRKVSLFVLFGAGIFIMTAAILRVVFVLVLGNGKTAAIWSCREDLVAILVGQAPMIRPLFTSKFWAGGYGAGSTAALSSTPANKMSGGAGMSYELSSNKNKSYRKKDPYSTTAMMVTMQESDSTEKIIDKTADANVYHPPGTPSDVERGDVGGAGELSAGGRLVVHVKNQVDVDTVEYSSTETTQENKRTSDFLQPGEVSKWGGRGAYGGSGGNGYAGRA